jgi:hypothetical protein
MRVDSIVLEHFLYDPVQMSDFEVRVYRVYYHPWSSTPSLELAGVLPRHAPAANPFASAGLTTLVSYYPSSPLVLDPGSLYAVAAAEALEGSTGPYLQFTVSTEQRGLPGWEMGEQLLGIDAWGFEFWLEPMQPGYLKFALNVAPADFPNTPPVISGAFTTVSTIWPPNGKMVHFKLEGISDPDDDPVSVEITAIVQNEPVWTPGDKYAAPDAMITGPDTAAVRAERLASGPGRVYAVLFTASDGNPGGTAEGMLFIVVPHDEGLGDIPEDLASASYYDSRAPY